MDTRTCTVGKLLPLLLGVLILSQVKEEAADVILVTESW